MASADEPDGPVPSPGAVLDAVAAVGYEWRLASDRLSWQGDAQRLLGCRPASGAEWERLLDPEALTSRANAVRGTARRDEGAGVPYEIDYPLRLAGGTVWVEDIGRWHAGPDGAPARAIGFLRRITERHEAEQRLAAEGRDPVSGTLTRGKLLDLLDTMLADAKRYQESCALLLVAIENLGAMNDAYGPDIADRLVAGVAQRLRGEMRAGDALGRFSTATFGLILNKCTAVDLDVAARRFLAAVHDMPLESPAGPVIMRLSAAGVVGPRHARSRGEMVAHAGAALRLVRRRARGTFLAYAPAVDGEADHRVPPALVQELMRDLRERRLRLAYQPVVEAAGHRVAWYEALARRADPAAPIAPLVAAAEQLGLVPILDRQMLEAALAALAADPGLSLALNVAAATTADVEWRRCLDAFLDRRPDDARRLVVEITETQAFADLGEAVAFVHGLRSRGIRVAIDDFGAGHTSFHALRALAVDLVKIDGEVVAGAARSAVDQAFLRAVVALAGEVGFKTVAERIETAAEARLLADIGIDYLQGDLFGVPGPLPDPPPVRGE
ncbi:MAG TPA: EAL domain-containing protein [Hyphomicrobiales bacterium]|nr:EAL domain-containing protein [Hyphomicrobiales bacterium]